MSLGQGRTIGPGTSRRPGGQAEAGLWLAGLRTPGVAITPGIRRQTIRQNVYPLTPNDLINTGDGGRHEFTTWSAGILGTFELPWMVRVAPFVRHQAGEPFGRTLASQVPGIDRILAEPIGTRRMPNLTSVDVRVEKGFRSKATNRRARVSGRLQLSQLESEQNVSWVSGTTFLRPLTIVPPRIARIGLKLDW